MGTRAPFAGIAVGLVRYLLAAAIGPQVVPLLFGCPTLSPLHRVGFQRLVVCTRSTVGLVSCPVAVHRAIARLGAGSVREVLSSKPPILPLELISTAVGAVDTGDVPPGLVRFTPRSSSLPCPCIGVDQADVVRDIVSVIERGGPSQCNCRARRPLKAQKTNQHKGRNATCSVCVE